MRCHFQLIFLLGLYYLQLIDVSHKHKVALKNLSHKKSKTTWQVRIKKAERSENHYYTKEVLLKLNCRSKCAVSALLLNFNQTPQRSTQTTKVTTLLATNKATKPSTLFIPRANQVMYHSTQQCQFQCPVTWHTSKRQMQRRFIWIAENTLPKT